MAAGDSYPETCKGETTDEKIIFGKTGNSASDNINIVRLHLGDRG